MLKTIHGIIHGKTIELDEDIGAGNGQEVEVLVKVIQPSPTAPPMTEGLAKVYAILGERYESGHTDTAERHNEHQP
jgi:hypothetical protein